MQTVAHCDKDTCSVQAAALGPFTFVSGKRTHGRCAAYMFAMHVEEELDDWPEANARTRQWVGPRTYEA
jgi:hypothetical protein